MTISVLDASSYFKGLLLLIRKDRKVTQPEIEVMKRVGKTLGFEAEFCTNAINEILENSFILDEPPVFSSKALAISFVKDGLSLAMADEDFHPEEERWLRFTAEKNGLPEEFFSQALENAREKREVPLNLEVEKLPGGNAGL